VGRLGDVYHSIRCISGTGRDDAKHIASNIAKLPKSCWRRKGLIGTDPTFYCARLQQQPLAYFCQLRGELQDSLHACTIPRCVLSHASARSVGQIPPRTWQQEKTISINNTRPQSPD
jgi:hypothetical protein